MATKAANIATILATAGNDWTESDLKGMSAAAVQRITDMTSKLQAPAEQDPAAAARAALLKDGWTESDLKGMSDAALLKVAGMSSKGSKGKGSKGTSDVVPAMLPALDLQPSAVVTYLQGAAVQPAGHYALPLNKSGENWTAETVRRNVLQVCTAAGIANWTDVAPLFIQGSLPLQGLMTAAGAPLWSGQKFGKGALWTA